MSHRQQLGFFQLLADANHQLVKGGQLLEIGAYDVNGTMRGIFQGVSTYLGVDIAPGPGVDLVAYGHEVEASPERFDICVSGECFEHDPYWQKTFSKMVDLVRPGGIVAFTCASRGRPEHGTRRTDPGDSPGTQERGHDYYHNLVESDFSILPLDEWFTEYRFWYLPSTFDLYFAGARAPRTSDRAAQLPKSAEVLRLDKISSPTERLIRLPLRLALRLVPDRKYQDVVVPYWNGMQRLAAVLGLR